MSPLENEETCLLVLRRRGADILVGGFTELSSSGLLGIGLPLATFCLSPPKSHQVAVGNTFENFSTKVRVSQSRSDL